ncbi:MAG: transcriptional regulator, marr family [Bacilli bacterium]|nr:transcriptional regulator, marr family [Bacilli bacterium]
MSSQDYRMDEINEQDIEDQKNELLKQMQGALEGLASKFKHETQQVNANEQLADGQIFLLFNLCKKGICNASDVANMIGITSGAVTGMTDKMVNMGLITRERSEEDRRVVLFSISEKGKEAMQRIRDKRFKRVNELFRQLTISELETTVNVFNKITDLIEKAKA